MKTTYHIIFSISILVVVLFISNPVYAEAMKYGYGNETCGHYVNVREGYRKGNNNDSMEYLAYVSWFYGVATSISATTNEDILKGRDIDAIALWIENYCKNNPLDSFFTASIKAIASIRELGK